MPLLTFEGVEVDIPTSLAGIEFAFADGALSIRCRGFSGDIVLSRPVAKAASRSTGTKRSAIDLSASDDDNDSDDDGGGGSARPVVAAPKRARPSFLSSVEESMLLAQLDPVSSAASSPRSSATVTSELDSVVSVDSHPSESMEVANGGKVKADPEQDKGFSSAAASVMSAFLRGGRDSVAAANSSSKTTQAALPVSAIKSKKAAKKSKQGGGGAAGSVIVSPEPKPPVSRSATPDSVQKKRGRPKKQVDDTKPPASNQPTKPSTSTVSAVTAQWETVTPSAAANATATAAAPAPPTGRWGHSATPISDNRVVVYGGADDDERTLGDLHVFDMGSRTWSRPLNCESVPRTWHDAVYLASKHLLLVFGGERLVDSGSADASGGDVGEEAGASGHMDILSDIMVLDTECFLWYPPAIRGSPPTARSGHTCTVLGNDVVVFGGSRGRNRQSTVHVLNSDEWMWRSIAIDGKPPAARTYHSAVAVGGDRIVYFGGNDSRKCFNSVHVLERASSLSAKKTRRGSKKSGEDDKDSKDDEVESNPTTSWSWFHPMVVGDSPRARTGHTATLVDGHKVLVVGGWDPQSGAGGGTVVFNDAFLLDTETWEWQRVPVEAAAGGDTSGLDDADGFSWVFPGRVGHRAVLDKTSGRVVLFGGQDEREDRLSAIHALSLTFGATCVASAAAGESTGPVTAL